MRDDDKSDMHSMKGRQIRELTGEESKVLQRMWEGGEQPGTVTEFY